MEGASFWDVSEPQARGAVRGAGTRWSDGLARSLLAGDPAGSEFQGFDRMERVCQPALQKSRALKEPCSMGSGVREALSCLCQPSPTPVPLLCFHQHHHCPESAEKAALITKINHPQGIEANLLFQNRPWVESGCAMGADFPHFPCFPLFSRSLVLPPARGAEFPIFIQFLGTAAPSGMC